MYYQGVVPLLRLAGGTNLGFAATITSAGSGPIVGKLGYGRKKCTKTKSIKFCAFNIISIDKFVQNATKSVSFATCLFYAYLHAIERIKPLVIYATTKRVTFLMF